MQGASTQNAMELVRLLGTRCVENAALLGRAEGSHCVIVSLAATRGPLYLEVNDPDSEGSPVVVALKRAAEGVDPTLATWKVGPQNQTLEWVADRLAGNPAVRVQTRSLRGRIAKWWTSSPSQTLDVFGGVVVVPWLVLIVAALALVIFLGLWEGAVHPLLTYLRSNLDRIVRGTGYLTLLCGLAFLVNRLAKRLPPRIKDICFSVLVIAFVIGFVVWLFK